MKIKYLLCVATIAVVTSCGSAKDNNSVTATPVVSDSAVKTEATSTGTPEATEAITTNNPENTENSSQTEPTSTETVAPTVAPTAVVTATPEAKATTPPSAPATTPTPVVATATPKPQETSAPEVKSSSGSISSSDLVFNGGSGSIKLGDPDDKIEKVLGTGHTTSEIASCINDGTDTVYMYGAAEVYTYEKSPGDSFVYEISILNNKYSTSKGVKVGDTKEKVISTYGNGYTEEGKVMVYDINGSSLQFFINGNTVQSISYLLFN